MALWIYFSNRLEALAAHLAAQVQAVPPGADPFQPQRLLVSSPKQTRWLQMAIARANEVAINLDCQYLEEGLWALLSAWDPTSGPAQLLDCGTLQRLLLAELQRPDPSGELALLHGYLRPGPQAGASAAVLRLWQLAGRLAACLREYEYHRAELTAAWRAGGDGLQDPGLPEAALAMARCQGALYRRLFAPGGAAARLGQALGLRLYTLPQYAELVLGPAEAEGRGAPAVPAGAAGERLYIFGLDQVSPFHRRLLYQLGQRCEIHLYQLNVCAEFWEDVTTPAEDRRLARLGRLRVAHAGAGDELLPAVDENRLLKYWGKPGRENLRSLSELEERFQGRGQLRIDWLPSPDEDAPATLLHTVQRQVLRRGGEQASPRRSPDPSLQLAACPGLYREVESIHQSILYNLQHDPALRLTDIAVIVTDPAAYRPVLHDVFARGPWQLPLSFVDGAAAARSQYAAGVQALFALAGAGFNRREFFLLARNPCFQAALGLAPQDVQDWLDWCERLHVVHSYDRAAKQRAGLPDSDLHTWRQGLRRLLLGRLMEAPPELPPDGLFRHWRDLVPFADMQSLDAGKLSRFALAVELLHRRLEPLPAQARSGAAWAQTLARLCDDFLAVPPELDEEEPVRRRLREALPLLAQFDVLDCGPLAWPLVESFIAAHLHDLGGRGGGFLTGGVNVLPLEAGQPLPFRVVYVAGLGEGQFVPPRPESGLDLRQWQRRLGDLDPADARRYALLEVLASTRDKLYLTYVSRDLAKDEDFQPCSAFLQLRRYLDEDLLARPGETLGLPLLLRSERYLTGSPPPGYDFLVNYSPADRLLGLLALQARAEAAGLAPLLRQFAERRDELAAALARLAPPLALPPAPPALPPAPVALPLRDLALFLRHPVLARLRSLGLYDDDLDEDGADVEDEPFFSSFPERLKLLRATLERYARRELADPPAAQQFLATFYDDQRRRGATPDGAFAAIDRQALATALADRLEGERQLQPFLAERAGWPFWPLVLAGEAANDSPGALRLPPAQFAAGPCHYRLSGALPCLWQQPDGAWECLVLAHGQRPRSAFPAADVLAPFLFFMAALADANAANDALGNFFGERPFTIHLATAAGLQKYAPFNISRPAARAWLAELLADWSERDTWDLLPYKLLASSELGSCPCHGADEASRAEQQDYAAALRELVADAWESDYGDYRPQLLERVILPQVPADAYRKVRRRFRPLVLGKG